jgi:hypothetical protein
MVHQGRRQQQAGEPAQLVQGAGRPGVGLVLGAGHPGLELALDAANAIERRG